MSVIEVVGFTNSVGVPHQMHVHARLPCLILVCLLHLLHLLVMLTLVHLLASHVRSLAVAAGAASADAAPVHSRCPREGGSQVCGRRCWFKSVGFPVCPALLGTEAYLCTAGKLRGRLWVPVQDGAPGPCPRHGG